MPANSAAMELKVLISILQSGTALKTLLDQTQQLTKALTNLQQQAGGGDPGSGINKIGQAGSQATREMMNLDSAIGKVTSGLRFLMGGFLAYQSVRFVKDLADTAARAEVLQTTLHIVARNAGIMSGEIDKVDKAVQRMGITASSSRQSLVQMLQAKLDVSWAPKLARAAQDLAVVSGMNSSATFQRLLLNIQQMDALGLRWMGIMVSREQAERRYAEANNTTVKALSRRQQVEAFMIETHQQLLTLEGAYAASMDNVGKQILSLERLTENLKKTLGDALLPAYSAIIAELGHLYEQLIVVAQVATANTDGAEAMGEAVKRWAVAIREWIVWGAQHIELITNLIRWLIELKLMIWGIRTAVWIGSGALALVDFFLKARLASQALAAGQVGLRAAMAALSAESVKAAAAQLELAAAEATAATAAKAATLAQAPLATGIQTTTTAVGALSTAWRGLGLLLAVPLFGYAILKLKQEVDKESADKARPAAQRAAEISGPVTVGGRLKHPDELLQEAFKDWLKENAGLVGAIESRHGIRPPRTGYEVSTKSPVSEAFLAQVAQARAAQAAETADKPVRDIYNKIIEERTKIASLQSQEQETALAAKTDEGARATHNYAREQREAAQASLKLLEAELLRVKGTNAVTIATDDLLAAQQKKWNAEEQFLKAKSGTDAEKAAADAELARTKAEADAAEERLSTALQTTSGMDADAAARETKAIREKQEFNRRKEQADNESRAIADLFKGKFEFPGIGDVQEAEFGQGAKNFGVLLDGFFTTVEDKAKAGANNIAAASELNHAAGLRLREALKTISGSVTDATMEEFRELARKYVEATGDVKTANDSLAKAGLSAQQQRLAFTAPITAERVTAVRQATDVVVEEAQRQLNALKTFGAAEGEVLEARYRQNLIGLDDYYKQRMERVEREGDAELNVQQRRIAGLVAQRDIRGQDPKTIAGLNAQITAERNKLTSIQAQTELELDRLIKAREQRQRDLERELATGKLGLAAQFGGEKEALEQLNFQLDQEKKKLGELQTQQERDEADELDRRKRISGEYEIQKRYREQALQAELALQQALRSQLDVQQQMRNVELARLAARVERGEVSDADAMRIRNEFTYQSMRENELKQESKRRDLASMRNAFTEEEIQYEQTLWALNVDQEEINKRLLTQQQQNQQALDGTASEVRELEMEWVNLATSIETYGERIRRTFVDSLEQALQQSIVNFQRIGETWKQFAMAISSEIASIIAKNMAQRLTSTLTTGMFNQAFSWLGGMGGGYTPGGTAGGGPGVQGEIYGAEGGVVSGPGTGTSDSIIAHVSAGEHIMPADKAARYMPLLEGIRRGTILPRFALGGAVLLQSIAIPTMIPRRYASGGVVVADGGASTVTTGGGGAGNMVVSLHPDALNMSMREWLEHEVVRQQGRR